MKPHNRYTICSLVAAACCSVSIAGTSQTLWTICTDELELIESKITNITQNEVVLVDQFGLNQSIPLLDIFFIVPANPITPSTNHDTEPTRMVTLLDGQVIQATIRTNKDPDFLACDVFTNNVSHGQAQIPLERILSITETKTPVVPPLDNDRITTLGGDVFTGFIESIGRSTSIDTDTGLIDLPINQIETISLANIKEQSAGIYISTTDGQRLKSSAFDIDFRHSISIDIIGKSIGLDSSAPSTWLLEPNAVAAVHVVHTSGHIESLTAITPSVIEPTGDRAWTPTPSIIENSIDPALSTIDLRAPVRVVYPIPTNTTRFACRLSAQINTWTDCIAEVYSISSSGTRTLLFNSPINANTPSHDLDLMIQPGEQQLEVRIEPGKNGPIQDRVLVEHPMLLIES